VDQLIKFGKVTRPILGIKFAPDQSVEQLGLSGVLVLDAPPNGPAGKAVRRILCFVEFRKNSTLKHRFLRLGMMLIVIILQF
jgi:hypothetical protein